MKFKTTIKEIKKALQTLEPIVNHAHSSLIHRYILVRKKGEKIEFKAFDDYTVGSSFISYYDLEGEEDAQVFILAKHFMGLINNFSKEEIKIIIEEDKCEVRCGKSVYKLQILEEEIVNRHLSLIDVDYYDIDELLKSESQGVIDTDKFSVAYGSVSHCLSKDTSNIALQNTYLIDNRMVACDSIRGASISFNTGGIEGLMLHKKACACLLNIPNTKMTLVKREDERGVFAYGISENFIFMTSCDDEYPYEKIKFILDDFSEASSIKIKINPDEIIDKLGRLLIFANPETSAISIDCNKKDFVLSVENKAKEVVNLFDSLGDLQEFSLVVDGKNLKESLSKSLSEAEWSTKGADDIQYISDGSLVQFFLSLLS